VEVASSAHLLLAMGRLGEHQAVIRKLAARVAHLELGASAATETSASLAAVAAATSAKAVEHEARLMEHAAIHAEGRDIAIAHGKQLGDVKKVAGAAEALAKAAKAEASNGVALSISAVAPAVTQLQDTVASLTPNPSHTQRQWRRLS
jgi:hypothetical protein